jgi:hypothetical protein
MTTPDEMPQQNLVLIVLDEAGQVELGRTMLEEFSTLPAGQSAGFSVRGDLGQQMNDLIETIRQVLSQEGLAPVADAIDLQIRVSRALMTPSDGDDIHIPIAAKGMATVATNPVTKPEVDESLFDLRDL